MKSHWKTMTFGRALQESLERQGLVRRIREQEVLQRWNELVGTAIANHTQPTRLRNGVLWIQVRDATWRQELTMMRTGLIEKINDALGASVVEEIRFR